MSRNFSKPVTTSLSVRLLLWVLDLLVFIPQSLFGILFKAQPSFEAVRPLNFITAKLKIPMVFGNIVVPSGAKVGYYCNGVYGVIALDSDNFQIIRLMNLNKFIQKIWRNTPYKKNIQIFPIGERFQWKLQFCSWSDEAHFDEIVIREMVVANYQEGQNLMMKKLIEIKIDFARLIGPDYCFIKKYPRPKKSWFKKFKIKLETFFMKLVMD